MKILLLNQFFWPDSAATSQLLTDLARGLEERGHDVSVICAESGGYALRDIEDPPAVAIHRVKALPFVRGSLGRVLSYASFFLTAAVKGLRLSKQDLVITLTTPPLISIVGSILKLLRGSRHFIWEMDVYPDVAVDLQYIKRGGLIDKVSGQIADFSRHKCDGILALGSCMQSRLVARGVPAAKIHIAENWADGSLIPQQPLRLSSGRLSLLYSGNLGLAHDVETLMHTMQKLKSDGRFSFVFAGGGQRREELERWCIDQGIDQAEFRSYSSRGALAESLGSADIGIITQRTNCVGSVVPSKLYGLLAAGRPVLFIGPAGSTVAEVIRRSDCGWHVECGDEDKLVDLLRSLAREPGRVAAAADQARRTFLEHYDRPLGIARICRLIGASGAADLELPASGVAKPVLARAAAAAAGGR